MGIIAKSLGIQALDDTPPVDPVYPGELPLRAPLRGNRAAVSFRAALTLPAAFRSVQITAGMAAQLTIDVWRGAEKIPTPNLIVNPDPWRTLDSWIERVVICMAGDGNAFLLKVKGPDGSVVALPALDPYKVTVRRDKNRRKFYDYTGNDKLETFNADEVIHLWGLEVPGADRGLGPIGYCRASIEGALDTRDYAADVFQNGSVSGGTLTTEQPLDSTAMKEYKKQWHEHDAGQIRILARGLKHNPVAISPKDAQWLESQTFGVLDVARMFGMPAPYLEVGVEGDAMTYQNLTQVDTKFLRTTLFPVYLRKIQAALTSALPRGQRAVFNTSALLEPDAKTRMEIHKIAIDSGVYDGDHARTIERIPGPAPKRKPAPAPAREEVPAE